uniref:Uncharacterized protein n=1 Tax=Rhizophora mucronata TaxID=61149 RepID=A0A2P2Q576_RHIMU
MPYFFTFYVSNVVRVPDILLNIFVVISCILYDVNYKISIHSCSILQMVGTFVFPNWLVHLPLYLSYLSHFSLLSFPFLQ